jgi:hypothetical protein
MLKRTLVLLAVLHLLSAPAMADSAPVNPWLAASPWPISHHDSYASDASPTPAPQREDELGAPQFVATGLVNISLPMSPKYPDGQSVWWGNNMNDVYKLGLVNGRLVKLASLKKTGSMLSALSSPTSGAYAMVTKDNTYISVSGLTVTAYGDAVSGNARSAIVVKKSVTLTSDIAASDDAIVGVNMMWDGSMAFATSKGVVGVIQPDFKTIAHLTLGSGQDAVSNSIASDENGGIYVVTSQAMYRVQWTGKDVSVDPAVGGWRATYNTGAGTSAGRLGQGSGSTPTLMGSGDQRFVAITDGATVNNVVLFWRDQIPADWHPITGLDPRIAAQMPVNFNDPQRQATQNEQSLTASGFGIVAVSNDYRNVEKLSALGASGGSTLNTLTTSLVELMSGRRAVQPWGVQKFEWNPSTRQLTSPWATLSVSCPNAIPTMSSLSQRFYCVGAYQNWWTIESLDWATGTNHFRKLMSQRADYNSFYSATQLNGDGSMIYGTLDGVVYLPAIQP